MSAAAFQIAAVDLQPSSVVPPGGQLSIIIDGTNTQQITAGTATVTVWYWGVPVLTASDTLCTATANPVVSSKHRKLLDSTSSLLPSVSSIWGSSILLGPGVHQGMTDDATCTMVPGPLHLTHAAQLPGIAPKGRYSMRLAAADMVTGQQIMCLDVWFRVG